MTTIANQTLNATIDKHKQIILDLPGVVGIGQGLKKIKGHTGQTPCITVFVRHKGQHHLPDSIPAELDGYLTDVIEHGGFGTNDGPPERLPTEDRSSVESTNPHERFATIFSGIAISTRVAEWWGYGTLGCMVRTTTHPPTVYAVTNQHVLKHCVEYNNPVVIQPEHPDPLTLPPANYDVGQYHGGWKDLQHDIALFTPSRPWNNEVPNHPWQPGRRHLRGIAKARVGQAVWKYGAKTKHTAGVVTNMHLQTHDYTNAILVVADELETSWCGQGDSGSVLLSDADMVLGLNFGAVLTSQQPDLNYSEGLAYDFQDQLNWFPGGLVLA